MKFAGESTFWLASYYEILAQDDQNYASLNENLAHDDQKNAS